MISQSSESNSLWRMKTFMRFYYGQTFGYIGAGLRTVMIPLLVYRLTSSATAVGITWALEMLPLAVLGLLGGSLADRLDRRKLMIYCDFINFAIMFFFAIAYASHTISPLLIYIGVIILASAGSIFLSAQTSAVPFLVDKFQVKSAVSLLQGTEQTITTVVPPIGGAILSLLGPLPTLLLNAFAYFASSVSIFNAKSFGPDKPESLPAWSTIKSDIISGWQFVMQDIPLKVMCYLGFPYNFVSSIGWVAFIPYLKREFFATDAIVGIAFGAMAIAAVAGSFIASRWHMSFGRAYVYASIIENISWFTLPWTHSLVVVFISIMIGSITFSFALANGVAWRMRIIPDDLTGRVFAITRMFNIGGLFFGGILGGYLCDIFGTRVALMYSLIASLSIMIILGLTPVLRNDKR